jgi:hypothetical protein
MTDYIGTPPVEYVIPVSRGTYRVFTPRAPRAGDAATFVD